MATPSEMATTSWQQGQNLLNQDQAKASQYQTDYGNYTNEADQANKNLQSEASYMQGEGSGQDVYNKELSTLESQNGYNPSQLADANKSLFSLTGALNATNAQFNTPGGVGMYGVSAPALASYEGSILSPLTTGVNTANTEVGTLNNELGTIQTGASQATSAQVQSEQNTVTALHEAVTNYTNLANNALSQMQFYSQLASTQGRLNSQEQADFAQAQQAYAQAQQAIARSKYLLAQTTTQDIINQGDINQLPGGTKIDGLTSGSGNNTATLGTPGNGASTVYYNNAGQTIGYENPVTHQDVQTVPEVPHFSTPSRGQSILNNFGHIMSHFPAVF